MIRSLTARLREAEGKLVEAQRAHTALAGELASWAAAHDRLTDASALAVERAHDQGYVDAAYDLAFRDRDLRILRRQLRFLEGVLRRSGDSFLEQATVNEALAQLRVIAAEEPALDGKRKETPP